MHDDQTAQINLQIEKIKSLLKQCGSNTDSDDRGDQNLLVHKPVAAALRRNKEDDGCPFSTISSIKIQTGKRLLGKQDSQQLVIKERHSEVKPTSSKAESALDYRAPPDVKPSAKARSTLDYKQFFPK